MDASKAVFGLMDRAIRTHHVTVAGVEYSVLALSIFIYTFCLYSDR